MGKSTKEILEEISSSIYIKSTHYKYPKYDTLPQRYIEGKSSAYDWLNDLCFYFMQKDKELLKEFQNSISTKKQELYNLKAGPYRNGILQTFNEIEAMIKKIETKN